MRANHDAPETRAVRLGQRMRHGRGRLAGGKQADWRTGRPSGIAVRRPHNRTSRHGLQRSRRNREQIVGRGRTGQW